MQHAAAPASRMLSLQQVEAQQAAQQLLQGQQQQQPRPGSPPWGAVDPLAAFGSVFRLPPPVEGAGPSQPAAEGAETNQVYCYTAFA